VRDGKYRDQFLVDWYQGGAGTSANMNANEVLANIGLELTGHRKGEYQYLEPHDDLNMSQSTNDSYPTAIKVAFILRNEKLIAELAQLAKSFRAKGNQYLEILKMGRTELQDAVPMTVGQEFHAFAASLEAEIQLPKDAEKYLYAVNMGATAIGIGINVPKGYPEACAAELAKLTKRPIVPATDMFSATWDQQESQQLLVSGSKTLRTKCVDGITLNGQVLAQYMETTVGIVTALNPVIGYEKATELATEAYKSGKGLLEIIREKKVLTEEQIKDLLDPAKLTNLNKSKYPQ
jgi:aspartate ammonia-lyase